MEETPKTVESKRRLPFGEWLVSRNSLTHRQLCEVLSEQKQHGGRLGEVLRRLKMLDDESVTSSLAEYLDIEYLSLHNPAEIEVDVARKIPERIAKCFSLIGISQDNERIVVAMADPLNIIAIDTVEFKTKCKVNAVISTARNIKDAIDFIYHCYHVA